MYQYSKLSINIQKVKQRDHIINFFLDHPVYSTIKAIFLFLFCNKYINFTEPTIKQLKTRQRPKVIAFNLLCLIMVSVLWSFVFLLTL